MAEKELVLLRKRREALDRAIEALEELQRLAEPAGRRGRESTSPVVISFPRVKPRTHLQHKQR